MGIDLGRVPISLISVSYPYYEFGKNPNSIKAEETPSNLYGVGRVIVGMSFVIMSTNDATNSQNPKYDSERHHRFQ